MLQKPPSITVETKKVYGTKTHSDEFGSFVLQDQVIGEEQSHEVQIYFRDGVNQQLVESALRHSPIEAITKHLTRLAIHKRLGSGDQDRAILLHDYTQALRAYSDFVIFTACQHFWEKDPSPFYPKIAVLQEICENIHQEIKNLHQKFLPAPQSKAKFEPSNYYQKPTDNPIRREICDFLVTKGLEDYFKDNSYSTYQLEMMAKAKFGYGKEGEDLARNLSAG